MTSEELLEKMLEIKNQPDDPEEQHIAADRLLIEYLKTNGLEEIADIYNDLPKWYA